MFSAVKPATRGLVCLGTWMRFLSRLGKFSIAAVTICLAVSSALAMAYRELGFETLADQVRSLDELAQVLHERDRAFFYQSFHVDAAHV